MEFLSVVDVRHPDTLGLLLDRVLGLLLRPDEQDGAVALGQVAGEVVRLLEAFEGLLEIDDVDPAALGEDETLHLRVPAAGLVTEVDSGLQELSHADDGHVGSFLSVCRHCYRRARGEPAFRLAGTATRPFRRVGFKGRGSLAAQASRAAARSMMELWSRVRLHPRSKRWPPPSRFTPGTSPWA
jgi:hypothetical protein